MKTHLSGKKLSNGILAITLSALLLLGADRLIAEVKPEEPSPVLIGVYILDVYNIDLREASFCADFYVWLRWKGSRSSEQMEKLESMNGDLQFIGVPDKFDKDEVHWRCFRCVGKFRSPLDFHDYPTDIHTLRIMLENPSQDIGSLKYQPDIENTAQAPSLSLGAWEQRNPLEIRESVFTYKTNFGSPSRSKGDLTRYSRFTVEIPIRHAGGGAMTYSKTFLPLFLSMAIALLAFLIAPQDLDPRFGVGVAGIFGAVSSMIVISNNTQESPYYTISDKVHIFTLLLIFITILISCISLRLDRVGKEPWRKRLDLYGGIGCLILYIGGVIFLSISEH